MAKAEFSVAIINGSGDSPREEVVRVTIRSDGRLPIRFELPMADMFRAIAGRVTIVDLR